MLRGRNTDFGTELDVIRKENANYGTVPAVTVHLPSSMRYCDPRAALNELLEKTIVDSIALPENKVYASKTGKPIMIIKKGGIMVVITAAGAYSAVVYIKPNEQYAERLVELFGMGHSFFTEAFAASFPIGGFGANAGLGIFTWLKLADDLFFAMSPAEAYLRGVSDPSLWNRVKHRAKEVAKIDIATVCSLIPICYIAFRKNGIGNAIGTFITTYPIHRYALSVVINKWLPSNVPLHTKMMTTLGDRLKSQYEDFVQLPEAVKLLLFQQMQIFIAQAQETDTYQQQLPLLISSLMNACQRTDQQILLIYTNQSTTRLHYALVATSIVGCVAILISNIPFFIEAGNGGYLFFANAGAWISGILGILPYCIMGVDAMISIVDVIEQPSIVRKLAGLPRLTFLSIAIYLTLFSGGFSAQISNDNFDKPFPSWLFGLVPPSWLARTSELITYLGTVLLNGPYNILLADIILLFLIRTTGNFFAHIQNAFISALNLCITYQPEAYIPAQVQAQLHAAVERLALALANLPAEAIPRLFSGTQHQPLVTRFLLSTDKYTVAQIQETLGLTDAEISAANAVPTAQINNTKELYPEDPKPSKLSCCLRYLSWSKSQPDPAQERLVEEGEHMRAGIPKAHRTKHAQVCPCTLL